MTSDPSGDPVQAPPTSVFAITEAFYWANPDWEPKTKILAAGAYNRARRWLLNPTVVLVGDELEAVTDYLDNASFLAAHSQSTLSAARAWLEG